MSVKAASLENRERGIDLSDRKGAAAELAELREKIRALRMISPPDDHHSDFAYHMTHNCAVCFLQGAASVLDALDEGLTAG